MTNGPSSVLDASALLAHLNDEKGADAVGVALIRGAAISTVNLAEVLARLARFGEDPGIILGSLRRQGLVGSRLVVVSLTEEDAVVVAQLRQETRAAGLPLGDRACLALAKRLRLPAITADRVWTRLKVGVTIQAIR